MADTRVPHGALSQQDVVEGFGRLLTQLGDGLASMIGADATTAVLWSALLAARRDYPVLHDLQVSDSGGQLEPLRATLGHVDAIELQHSLAAYLDSVVALVADIIGEVLVLKIAPLVQEFQQRLED